MSMIRQTESERNLLKQKIQQDMTNELTDNEIKEFLFGYNNYITESKSQIFEIIRSLEYDIYLIEKLREVDSIDDIFEHDKKTFEVVLGHYQQQEEIKEEGRINYYYNQLVLLD